MKDLRLAQISYMYYENEISQQDIAKKLDLSKMAVSRILQKAREAKIIRLSIRLPYTLSQETGKELCRRFGLKEAYAVRMSSGDGGAVSETLGRMWAFHMGVTLPDGCVLGMGVGKTVGQMVQNLTPMRTKGVHVVQLMGGLADVTYRNPFTIVQETCRKLHAEGTYFTSCAVVENEELKDSIVYKTKMGQQVRERWDKCDMALFGVGPIETGTLRTLHMLSDGDIDRLKARGVVGDFLGHFFDGEGKFVETEFEARLVSIPLETLRNIPMKVALAGGEEKARALAGALKTGMIDTLVTDEVTGKRVLELEGS
jgi:DNA-binding transcriptional regulator LsrR (DeoR family)